MTSGKLSINWNFSVSIAALLVALVAILQTCNSNRIAKRSMELAVKEADSERVLIWCGAYDPDEDTLVISPCAKDIHAQDILVHWPSEVLNAESTIRRRLDPTNARIHLAGLRQFASAIDDDITVVTLNAHDTMSSTQPELSIPIAIEARYVAKGEFRHVIGGYLLRVPVEQMILVTGAFSKMRQEPSVPTLMPADDLLTGSTIQSEIDSAWLSYRAESEENIVVVPSDVKQGSSKIESKEGVVDSQQRQFQLYSHLDDLRFEYGGYSLRTNGQELNGEIRGRLTNTSDVREVQLQFYETIGVPNANAGNRVAIPWMDVDDMAGRSFEVVNTIIMHENAQVSNDVALAPGESVKFEVQVRGVAEQHDSGLVIRWWRPGTANGDGNAATYTLHPLSTFRK